MSYAVKTGTTQAFWIADGATPDGCVRFDGALLNDPITHKSLMVWDSELKNIREKTPDEKRADLQTATIQALEAGVQLWLDKNASSFGYDDANSAISYVGDAVDLWHRQGVAFKEWRSHVWMRCIGIQAAVLAGQAPVPSLEELIAQLPQPAIPIS